MMQRKKYLILALLLVGIFVTPALQAQRIKDIARVAGVQQQYMKGPGLVIGLAGTGDSTRSTLTKKVYANLLGNLNFDISEEDLRSRNIAVVMVTATVSSTLKTGSLMHVTVSSIGDAKSLEGGFLLEAVLYGHGSDLEHPLAVAQGIINANEKTLTRGQATAILQEDISIPFRLEGNVFSIVLHKPDFSTANRIARKINEFPILRRTLGGSAARALDPGHVEVTIPKSMQEQSKVVALISRIMSEVPIPEIDRQAIVVIHKKTGMVTINGSVRISPVMIIQGENRIRIPGPDYQGEANPLLIEVIDELRDSGFSEQEIPQMIRSIDVAGALIGTLKEV